MLKQAGRRMRSARGHYAVERLRVSKQAEGGNMGGQEPRQRAEPCPKKDSEGEWVWINTAYDAVEYGGGLTVGQGNMHSPNVDSQTGQVWKPGWNWCWVCKALTVLLTGWGQSCQLGQDSGSREWDHYKPPFLFLSSRVERLRILLLHIPKES